MSVDCGVGKMERAEVEHAGPVQALLSPYIFFPMPMSRMLRVSFLLLLALSVYAPEAWSQAALTRAYQGDAAKQHQIWQSARLLQAQQNAMPRLHQQAGARPAFSLSSPGSISGQLLDIADPHQAHVVAFSLIDSSAVGELWFPGEVQDDGTYIIRDLIPGDYYVLVEAADYLPMFYDNVMQFDQATPVTVDSMAVENINFTMQPFPSGSGSISGTVLGTDGDVPGRGTVMAYMVDNTFLSFRAPLGEDGSYTLAGLAPGNYYVQAAADGYFTSFYEDAERIDDATPVSVDENEVVGIDFTLSLGGTIAGRAVDQDGNPLAGAHVFAETDFRTEPPADGIWGHGFALTDEEGNYRISGLPEGNYLVHMQQDISGLGFFSVWYDNVGHPENATAVSVARDQEANGIDFVLDLPNAFGSVSGKVAFIDGATVSRGVVELIPMLTGGDSLGIGGWLGQSVDLDAEGRYAFDRVLEGDYIVAVHLWELGFSDTFFYPGTIDRSAATPIMVVEDGALTDVDIAINPGGRISGQVTDQDGNPVAHAEVGIQTKSGPAGPFRPDRYYWTATDEDGNYFVAGLPAGEYYVRIETSVGFVHVVQWYDGAFDLANATPVAVLEDQETAGINFTLLIPNAFGALAGRLAFSDGSPVPFGFVEALYQGASVNPDTLGGLYGATAYIDRQGHYVFDQLPIGDYLIRATMEMDGLHQTLWYDGAEVESDATPVSIMEDQRVEGIDFAFSPGATIAGQVTDQLGNPLPDVQVTARSSAQHYFARTVATDSNGMYQLHALGDGTAYQLYAAYMSPFLALTQSYPSSVTATEAGATGINFVFDVPTEFGSIAGRVMDTNGQPMGGVGIYVVPDYTQPDSTTGFTGYDGARGQYTETDREGNYWFDDVPVGEYILSAQVQSATLRYPIWYPNANSPDEATPITVTANAETGGIEFIVPTLEGVIRGTLTDAEGKAIPHSSVQLESIEGTGFLVRSYASTDKAGNFVFSEVPDGQYRLLAYGCAGWQCIQEWWDGASQPGDATPVVVTSGVSDPLQVNFQISLQQGSATVAGQVTRASDGSPLINAFVNITAQNDNGVWTSAFANTDSTGQYQVENLPPGTYTAYAAYWENEMTGQAWFDGAVRIEDATPIVITDSLGRSDVNFSLDIRPMFGAIAGVVTDAETGAPLERAYVEVNPIGVNYEVDRIAFFQPNVTVTEADGSFRLDRLWAGNQEYTVRVFATGREGATVEGIQIIGGEVAEANVALAAQNNGAGEVSGTVASREGIPVEVAVVRAMQQTEDGGIGTTYTAIVAEDGTYTMPGLPDGSYILMSFAPWHIGLYYNDVYDPADATPVVIENGAAIGDISFELDPMYFLTATDEAMVPGARSGTSVFGMVTDDEGKPVADATIYVLSGDNEAVSFTRTHTDGSYELAEVPPGAEYRLKATALGYEGSFHDGTHTFDDATPISTNTGRMEMNFVLETAATSVGTEPELTLPTSIELLGNYPNPFNPTTRIVFALPERMHVKVRVYDTLGRDLGVFFDGTLDAGRQSIVWEASSSGRHELSSGVYFYQIEGANQAMRTGKMLLLR